MLRYAASTSERGTPAFGGAAAFIIATLLFLASPTTLIPGITLVGATQPYPGQPHNATPARYAMPITYTAREYYSSYPSDASSLTGPRSQQATISGSGPAGGESPPTNSSQEDDGGIHVASWNWQYVRTPFIYTAFVVIAGLCKVGFHRSGRAHV